ncbi:MAG TPA: fumarate/nitrate reduction transcriptional regulator Fnr [Acidiferrobacterales bacterium]|nr:fumarate/nitrate reduction transcriptional regulator Fnr [Acidiferrobacterales bacterium]
MPAHHLEKINIAKLKVACSTCTLRELCLPIGLNAVDLDRVDSIINRRQRYKSGQHVYRTGDLFQFLYAIRLGSFKTYELNKDGREQVSGFHMAGELIGLDAISSDMHVCSAVALEDGEICEIPFVKLESLSREIPTLQRQFHRFMSREITSDHRLMMLLGTLTAEERLATFLSNLSERLQARGFSPRTIHLTMSREEIGNYLGLKLETVSRMFSKFQEEGLVEVDRRELKIKDTEALKRIAECNKP